MARRRRTILKALWLPSWLRSLLRIFGPTLLLLAAFSILTTGRLETALFLEYAQPCLDALVVFEGFTHFAGAVAHWLHQRPWLEPGQGWVFFLPPAAAVVGLAVRWRFSPKSPSCPARLQHRPPDHLTPAELSAVLGRGDYRRRAAATLVDLAVRGQLELIETTGKWGSVDYVLRQHQDEPAARLAEHERGWFWPHFRNARLSACDPWSFCSNRQLFEQLSNRGYFIRSPLAMKWFLAVGVQQLTHAAMIISYAGTRFTPGLFAAWLVAGVVLGVCVWPISTRTDSGTHTLERALGFESFLLRAQPGHFRSAEAAREVFERYLPYAMALGHERSWARMAAGAAPRFRWCTDHTGNKALDPAEFTPSLCNAVPGFRWGQAFSSLLWTIAHHEPSR